MTANTRSIDTEKFRPSHWSNKCNHQVTVGSHCSAMTKRVQPFYGKSTKSGLSNSEIVMMMLQKVFFLYIF
jgi:hypothetical protein